MATAFVGNCIGRHQHRQQRQRNPLATASADIVTVCIGNGLSIGIGIIISLSALHHQHRRHRHLILWKRHILHQQRHLKASSASAEASFWQWQKDKYRQRHPHSLATTSADVSIVSIFCISIFCIGRLRHPLHRHKRILHQQRHLEASSSSSEASSWNRQRDQHRQSDPLATAFVGNCIGRREHSQQRQRNPLATATADILTVYIGNGFSISIGIGISISLSALHHQHGQTSASYASAQAYSSSTEAFKSIITLQQMHHLGTGRSIIWAPAEASFGLRQRDQHRQSDPLANAFVGNCIGRHSHRLHWKRHRHRHRHCIISID